MVEKEITSHMRLEMSRSWLERAKSKIPGCAQTFSKSPISFMQGVAPNFLQKAMGAHVWDVDGNRYIDYVMGLGPVVLGHADPTVNAAVRAQMEQGMSFSLPHPIEVEVSELLCELIPCAEMVRLGKTARTSQRLPSAWPALLPSGRKLSVAAITAGRIGISDQPSATAASLRPSAGSP